MRGPGAGDSALAALELSITLAGIGFASSVGTIPATALAVRIAIGTSGATASVSSLVAVLGCKVD